MESEGETSFTIKLNAVRNRRYVTISFVLYIIASSIAVLIPMLLLKEYSFWDPKAQVALYFMLGMGIWKLFIATCGFLFGVVCFKTRFLHILLTPQVIITVIIQKTLVSIFCIVLKPEIVLTVPNMTRHNLKVDEHEKYYDDITTENWDNPQIRRQCCGVTDHIGWTNTGFGNDKNTVPDSCCRNETKHCWKDILNASFNIRQLKRQIFLGGCFDTLNDWRMTTVVPMLHLYSATTAAILFIEIVIFVLMSRQRKGENSSHNTIRLLSSSNLTIT